jgi:predicted transcriptional regulator
MNVKELVEKFGMTVHAGENGLNKEVKCGHCGDLLSEVMGNAGSGCIWITVQSHMNIVAVAVLREMSAIVITGDNVPDNDTMNKANSEGIPLLSWKGRSYKLAGELAKAGII